MKHPPGTWIKDALGSTWIVLGAVDDAELYDPVFGEVQNFEDIPIPFTVIDRKSSPEAV